MQELDLIIAIFIMTLITFSQKWLPFLVLEPIKNSKVISYLAKQLPPSIMIILTLYALKMQWQGWSYPSFVPISAALFTACVHTFLRKTLISISAGIVVYAILKFFFN
jgi:branched-subunit amino acid transport protein AzlD